VENLIYGVRVPKARERERSPNTKHSKTRYLAEEKSELMNKYLKYFTQFTNSIDFDKL